jgi:ligand-binding SRPBCC domain-containing protein
MRPDPVLPHQESQMALHVLRRKQFLPLPRTEAFEFFADAANLEEITPPWLNFRIVSPTPIDIRTGAIIEYKLSWRGIPIAWTTEIRKWNPPYEFVDTQIRGPYQLWHHTHKFEEVEGGTMMTDVVWYKVPGGPLGEIVHSMQVKRDVRKIFDYRYHRIGTLLACPECV